MPRTCAVLCHHSEGRHGHSRAGPATAPSPPSDPIAVRAQALKRAIWSRVRPWNLHCVLLALMRFVPTLVPVAPWCAIAPHHESAFPTALSPAESPVQRVSLRATGSYGTAMTRQNSRTERNLHTQLHLCQTWPRAGKVGNSALPYALQGALGTFQSGTRGNVAAQEMVGSSPPRTACTLSLRSSAAYRGDSGQRQRLSRCRDRTAGRRRSQRRYTYRAGIARTGAGVRVSY